MKYTEEQIRFVIERRSAGDSWQDIAVAFGTKFGKELNSKGLPSPGWDALRQLHSRHKYQISTEELVSDSIRSRHVARRRAAIVARENREILDEVMSQDEFIEKLQELNKIAPINIFKQPVSRPRKKTKRTIVAHISDTHIGVNINKSELGHVNSYNSVIAARRLGLLFREIINYKREHRDETNLVVVLNGDIITGVIHSLEGGSVDDLTNQYAQAIRYFVSGISLCAAEFKKVDVYTTVGNHGRYTHKANKGQQSDSKWDSHEMNIYLALREILKSHSNVKVHLSKTPYALFAVHGHTFFATHGDTVLKMGNVSKTISMQKIKNEVNDIQVGLGKKIDVLMVGHVHKQTFQTLDNGTEVLVNGCLSGVDSFAQSIGIFSNNPAQQIFEVTEDFAVGDVRFVRVKHADNDKKLDNIIKPVESFEDDYA